MIIIGIVKELTAPKVRAIPRTLKYAAQPAINNAEVPIIRVNKFIPILKKQVEIITLILMRPFYIISHNFSHKASIN